MSTPSPFKSAADDGRNPISKKESPIERGMPLLGVLPALLRNAPEELVRIIEKHSGEIPIVRAFPMSFRLLTHPSHARHVLQENWRNYSRRSPLWEPVHRLLGDGLLFSEGELWQKRRRLMQPLFLNKHIAGLIDSITVIVGQHLDRLAVRKAGEPVDMVKQMRDLVMTMSLQGMFGVAADAHDGHAAAAGIQRGQRIVGLHMLLSGLPSFIPRPGQAKLDRILKTLDDLILKSVEQVRASPHRPPTDILTLLVRASDDQTDALIDDRGLRDELMTLFTGGNDTTSATLAWLWYALDSNPLVMTKLQAELDATLQGRTPTFEDLARMPYARRVLQETMRRFCTVLLLPRIALDDDVIDGFRIARGETVVLSPYAFQLNSAVWERPRDFDPNRFTPEQSASRDRFAFIAFGGGPRQCIGLALAMAEMQVVLAMTLQRFRPRLIPGHPTVTPRAEGGVVPHPGLRMLLEPVRS